MYSKIDEQALHLIQQDDLEVGQYARSLFQTISCLLYQTDMFSNAIRQYCTQYFKTHGNKYYDVAQVQEYLVNPQHNQFDYLNLELISQIFRIKIELFQVDDGLYCTFFNHGFEKSIKIFKHDTGYYELYTLQYTKKFKFVRKILNQVVNNFLMIEYSRSSQKSDNQYPKLDVQFQINEIGVRSNDDKKYPYKITTPQQPNSVKLPNNKSIGYGPITPEVLSNTKKSRVFNYQIQQPEKQHEDDLFNDISRQTQQQPQQNVIANQGTRSSGRLKFFNEAKQYGFFEEDGTKKNIFVHLDDMIKSNIDQDIYQKVKKNYGLYFSFQVILYQGKQQQNVKAIDIKLEKIEPPPKK
ncbi:hypothetical protein pb186bvf_020288 [Paramecium bursaria]